MDKKTSESDFTHGGVFVKWENFTLCTLSFNYDAVT